MNSKDRTSKEKPSQEAELQEGQSIERKSNEEILKEENFKGKKNQQRRTKNLTLAHPKNQKKILPLKNRNLTEPRIPGIKTGIRMRTRKRKGMFQRP